MVHPDQAIFLGLDDGAHIARVVVRLAAAAVLGGIIGLERELDHKRAGVRTHMLTALGSALFVLIAGETHTDLSRVLQGIATGVGFLGAGTIFKWQEQHEVKGLTTAASIWVTAAAGAALGAGMLWPILIAVALAWIILKLLQPVIDYLTRLRPPTPSPFP
jgi:putative Mg2+ transporter-C (MgtC) family protein